MQLNLQGVVALYLFGCHALAPPLFDTNANKGDCTERVTKRIDAIEKILLGYGVKLKYLSIGELDGHIICFQCFHVITLSAGISRPARRVVLY